MSAEGQKLLRLLPAKNGLTGRIQLAGRLTPALLQERLQQARRPAVILDVEGAELELLDFRTCPDLARAFIILENHLVDSRSTVPEMRRRFAATHDIQEIPIQNRTLGDLPPALRRLARFGFKEKLLRLLDEGRFDSPPWLQLRPL